MNSLDLLYCWEEEILHSEPENLQGTGAVHTRRFTTWSIRCRFWFNQDKFNMLFRVIRQERRRPKRVAPTLQWCHTKEIHSVITRCRFDQSSQVHYVQRDPTVPTQWTGDLYKGVYLSVILFLRLNYWEVPHTCDKNLIDCLVSMSVSMTLKKIPLKVVHTMKTKPLPLRRAFMHSERTESTDSFHQGGALLG